MGDGVLLEELPLSSDVDDCGHSLVSEWVSLVDVVPVMNMLGSLHDVSVKDVVGVQVVGTSNIVMFWGFLIAQEHCQSIITKDWVSFIMALMLSESEEQVVFTMFASEMCPSEPTSNSILFSQRSGEGNWCGFASTNSVIAQLRRCLDNSHYVDHWSRGLVLLEHSDQVLNGINELAFAQSEDDVSKLTIKSWFVEFSSTEAEPVVIV